MGVPGQLFVTARSKSDSPEVTKQDIPDPPGSLEQCRGSAPGAGGALPAHVPILSQDLPGSPHHRDQISVGQKSKAVLSTHASHAD